MSDDPDRFAVWPRRKRPRVLASWPSCDRSLVAVDTAELVEVGGELRPRSVEGWEVLEVLHAVWWWSQSVPSSLVPGTDALCPSGFVEVDEVSFRGALGRARWRARCR